jgi:GT2 family glycosyltransferase
MSVTAVIPHWNRRDLLLKLLTNLREQTRAFDEVIVVDNGSTDDSVQVAERAGARAVRLGKNLGFAAAVNRGVTESQSDWIAVLNNDVTLSADWLATLLASATSGEIWFATGKLLMANDPSLIDATFDAISRGACPYRCGSGKPDGPLWNQPRQIRMAPMTAMLIRKRLFEEIGPLDERFESYLEDVDFGLRCCAAGKAGIYVPVAVGQHEGSATQGRWNNYTVRQIARNQVLLAAKHFQGESRWPIVVGQLLWGLLALRHGCALAYLRGKIAGLRLARAFGETRPGQPGGLGSFIQESEREILAIQRQTGFDRYWRAYFCLLRP